MTLLLQGFVAKEGDMVFVREEADGQSTIIGQGNEAKAAFPVSK